MLTNFSQHGAVGESLPLFSLDGTIYRAFDYGEDGNNLVKVTDARGNVTEYTVDGVTSRNEEIVDRLGNKTAYEYDDSGRTTKVISKTADNTEIANVSYGYDVFDNLTEIARGDGLKYGGTGGQGDGSPVSFFLTF